jgi:hypothetical protein
MIQSRRDFQIKFAVDQGFTAWEDNGLPERSPQEQERIGKTLTELGMEHGNSIRGKEGELALIESYRKVDAN